MLLLFVDRPLLARFGVVVLVFRDEPLRELEPLVRRLVRLVEPPLARLRVLALVVFPDELLRVFPDEPLGEPEPLVLRELEPLVRRFVLLVESAIPHLS